MWSRLVDSTLLDTCLSPDILPRSSAQAQQHTTLDDVINNCDVTYNRDVIHNRDVMHDCDVIHIHDVIVRDNSRAPVSSSLSNAAYYRTEYPRSPLVGFKHGRLVADPSQCSIISSGDGHVINHNHVTWDLHKIQEEHSDDDLKDSRFLLCFVQKCFWILVFVLFLEMIKKQWIWYLHWVLCFLVRAVNIAFGFNTHKL